jgi:hypothetical protein
MSIRLLIAALVAACAFQAPQLRAQAAQDPYAAQEVVAYEEPIPEGWSPGALLVTGVLVVVAVAVAIYARRRFAGSGRHASSTMPSKSPPVEVAAPASPPRPPSGGHTIFISYRRADSADITGRIYDRLTDRFGKEHVYKDVDSIPLGVDFRKHVGDLVQRCDVVIAVIGNQWAGGTGGGARRLDDPRDLVRIEVAAALARGIPVVPVLVGGATVPGEADLPEELQGLAYRNGTPVRPDPDFHKDLDRLIAGIDAHFGRS